MLKALAVAAPEHATGKLGSAALTSADPFSLYQAGREAARLADCRIGAWGDSNWAGGRGRSEKFLLMHNFEHDLAGFRAALERERPNLLLIGAMTLSLPGAVRCAEAAREQLGDAVAIVLGGHHTSETIYSSRCGEVLHHSGSPVRLVTEGRIPEVFDLCVSGEAEFMVAALGERVAKLAQEGRPVTKLAFDIEDIAFTAPGSWIASWSCGGVMHNVVGHAGPIDRNRLLQAGPARLFGVHTYFDTFDGRATAHVMSDSGSGCVHDCKFCSERRTVSGIPAQLESSASRLFSHMAEVKEVVAADYPGGRASAFVEDSTLLAGRRESIKSFASLMTESEMDLPFGAQLTIDQIFLNRDLLGPLRTAGMVYVFVGLETVDPSIARGMSKSVGRDGAWADRATRAFEVLAANDIEWGTALLFGMGEARSARIQMFRHLENWRNEFGSPFPISMNWAVQHPLRGSDGGANYHYDKWGTAPGPLLEAFQSFGEASERYPIVGVAPPSLDEVQEVLDMFQHLPIIRRKAA